MNLLLLGCGSGTDSYFFAQHGHIVIGTDLSEVVITRDKNIYHAQKLSFQVVDISRKMPFEENLLDCVYARLSLHYFTNIATKKVSKEIFRVLKPSGYFCIICKSTEDPLFGKGKNLEENGFENEGYIRKFFNEEYAKECLEDLFEIKTLTSGKENFYWSQSAFVKAIVRKKQYLKSSQAVPVTSHRKSTNNG